MVTESEKSQILSYARNLLKSMVCSGAEPEMPDLPVLHENGCCFVTLMMMPERMLRGCIGHLEAFEPLGENIARNVANAAFSDPRFEPLEPDEYPSVALEISILSPRKSIASLTEFELGRDGIAMECAGHHAVFLPQVPREQHWDKETTLRYLSRKAGLPENAWQSPETSFETFTAQVLEE